MLEIEGEICPATQDYIVRGIAEATDMHAKVVIIQLDTPGGLETSMRGINAAIINSAVPVITYVAPAGSRAASAGTYILYASHFAAMAPGTDVGAASPVRINEENRINNTLLDIHQKKAINDAAAYLRSLAELRGRNVEWATIAVTEAASISAEEAKRLNVINVVASDLTKVLAAADGTKTIVHGEPHTIDTKNLLIEKVQPDWRNKFLSFITDPNIAYILMLVALYGLFFEFSNPGLILPGVAGIIALLLALLAFQLMPINYVGLSLILIGITFMVIEIYITSFGVIGIGGIIAFILGSIMLYDSNDPQFRVTSTLIFAMATLTAAFFFMMIVIMLRSQRHPSVSGKTALIGKKAVVISVVNGKILVSLMGEIWNAESESTLTAGQQVIVLDSLGLTLFVAPLNKDK